MAELRWEDYEKYSVLTGTDAQVRFRRAIEQWIARASFMGVAATFSDRAAAKRAIEAQLIRRCRAELAALEALHAAR